MAMVEDAVIVSFSVIVFFAGGWVFFMKQLFRDYEVHHHRIQLIFSVTFALSCFMFELIIFEILGRPRGAANTSTFSATSSPSTAAGRFSFQPSTSFSIESVEWTR